METKMERTPTGRGQLKRVRKDGWTKKCRRILLQGLAATGNIAWSCKAAGKSQSAYFALRWRDPEFAAQCRAALMEGYDRIEAGLITRSEWGQTTTMPDYDGEGEIALPDPGQMDVELAFRLLQHRQRVLAGLERRAPTPRRIASREETNAAILKKLKVLNRRLTAQPHG